MNYKMKICGIPYKVEFTNDSFGGEVLHLGQHQMAEARILINAECVHEVQQEALCHEAIHAILSHIGRDDLNADEVFVQSFANAIFQSFMPRLEET